MDITQLLLPLGLALGVLLVGLMAIVPTVMESGPDDTPLRSRATAAAGPGRG